MEMVHTRCLLSDAVSELQLTSTQFEIFHEIKVRFHVKIF